MAKIQILIADDHVLMRETLVEYLERDDPSFDITEADNLAEVHMLLEQKKFNLIILDWHMRGFGDLNILQNLIAQYPEQKIVIMSGVADQNQIKKMHDLCIQGFIPKTVSGKEFIMIIKEVLAGDIHLSNKPTSDKVFPDEAILTDRQVEVLDHIKKGLSNKKIAHALDISEVTVKLHVNQILEKFKCHSRTELMAKWIA